MHKFALSTIAVIAASAAGLSASADCPNRACKNFTADMGQSILGGPVKQSDSSSEADTVMGQTWLDGA